MADDDKPERPTEPGSDELLSGEAAAMIGDSTPDDDSTEMAPIEGHED